LVTLISGVQGILHHSILPLLWREPDFPASLHGFILALLNRFEIAFTMNNVHVGRPSVDASSGDSTDLVSGPREDLSDADSQVAGSTGIDYNGVSLIPCLLSEERPKDMDTLWPKRRYQSTQMIAFLHEATCVLRALSLFSKAW
jgi:hypothetical protein